MSFHFMLNELKNFREIRRKSWGKGFYVFLAVGVFPGEAEKKIKFFDSENNEFKFSAEDIMAEDWEVV